MLVLATNIVAVAMLIFFEGHRFSKVYANASILSPETLNSQASTFGAGVYLVDVENPILYKFKIYTIYRFFIIGDNCNSKKQKKTVETPVVKIS